MQQPPAGLPGQGLDERYDDAPQGERRGFSPFNFLVGFGVGSFVGVGLALLAFAMVDEDPEPAGSAVIQPDEPAVASTTPAATAEARPRAKTALDVRLGPGNGFAVVGVLARGDSVEVVGRDNASEWLAIRFPPGSSGRGWIPVTAVDEPPDPARLAVVIPTPLPRTIATFPPGAFDGTDVGTGASTVPTSTPDPLATPALRPGPVDLVVVSMRLLPDRRVSVTVANRGPNDLAGFTIFVQVRDLGARSEMVSAAVPSVRVGSTVTLETGTFRVSGEEAIQAIVDPFGSVPEVDRTNNLLQITLAAPPPTSTPTPGPSDTGL
jgi:hypothetical protein